ncbi:MAG: hypothetical protein SGI74_10645 [Oligoflexia bacterium]|nr:hypothetical protein [Oligoflexia bacterium]
MFYEVAIEASETANKCTIAPLYYRSDFRLIQIKGPDVFGPLNSSILLHHKGKCLTTVQKTLPQINGIATIDCVWRRLDQFMGRIAGKLPELVRIPDGFETAYPRRSVNNADPTGGLATIEAIFVAAAVLGNWDTSLLAEYYFGAEFIKINEKRFVKLGVTQATDNDLLPKYCRQRSSMQRRRDRGRY